MVESDKAKFLDSKYSCWQSRQGEGVCGVGLALGVCEGSRQCLCLTGVWTNRPWTLQETELFKKHHCSWTGIFSNRSTQLICKFLSLNISWKCHSSATETEHPLSVNHFLPKPEEERGERHSLRQVLSAATLLPRSSWALASPPSCLTTPW